MNLAEQMKADINFNKILLKLQIELQSKDSVFIKSSLAENNIQRLREEGFHVDDTGEWRNGGVYVSFRVKSQYE
jgi:hypothetical protein